MLFASNIATFEASLKREVESSLHNGADWFRQQDEMSRKHAGVWCYLPISRYFKSQLAKITSHLPR